MNRKKYLAFLLIFVLLFSIIGSNLALAVSPLPGERTVYLHAKGASHQGNDNRSTVYMGDTAEIYFAVDTPNRGDYISETDPRNADIMDEISLATADVVQKYETKVKTESGKAVDNAVNTITEWYNSPAGAQKDKLALKIENSDYKKFLIKDVSELTNADFVGGKLNPESVFDIFVGTKYNNIFNNIYGTPYQYSYIYRYEYEYFYLSKIDAEVTAVLDAISEYNSNIADATLEADKTALKETLCNKYNAVFPFLTVADDFSVEFDEDAYRVYMREIIHSQRVKRGSKFYVGKDAEEKIRHIQPEYDLNGYTVRIYYDPDFFKLKDENSPINYNAPGLNSVYTTESKDENIDSDTEETPLDDGLWVYKMETFPEKNGYASVAATVFASGIYFPNKEDEKNWYTLCSLPLEPLKTGRTQVYLEVPGTNENSFPLTLFAKHKPDADGSYSPTFNVTMQHGGYHSITIEDKNIPPAPVAIPASGIYKEGTEVKLTANEDCTIYYKLNGDTDWRLYSYPDQDPATITPIKIEWSQSILCKAVRTKDVPDGEVRPESHEIQYDYTIIPETPYLWENASSQIISSLYKNEPFRVYPSDSNTEYKGSIDPDRILYYTFNENLTAADLPDGTSISAELARNPLTQWTRLTNNNPAIDITDNVNLRMIAKKNDTYSSAPMYSDISEFMLGIKPLPAEDRNYNPTPTGRHSVTLTTSNTYDVEIYYTLDGTNPITSGLLYTDSIAISKDTTLKTVVKVPGKNIYSDVKTYVYDFENEDIVAFYPAGTYVGSISVALSTLGEDCTIEYFVKDGNFDPDFTPEDSDFVRYENNKLTINKNLTVYAKAIYPDGTSRIYDFEYVIKPLAPIFSPKSQQFVTSGEVGVYAANQDVDTDGDGTKDINYTLYYTTDGSDPSDPSNNRRTAANDDYDGDTIPVGSATEIKAVVYADYGEYSEVVSHQYSIVANKPKKPAPTLMPGIYTKANGDTVPLVTEFGEQPTDTEIYYTVGYAGEAVSTPYPGEAGTHPYNAPIPIKGITVIKAVAINESGVRSDLGTFTYIVMPDAPVAAPSGSSAEIVVIPVTTHPGAEIRYTLTGSDGLPTIVEFSMPSSSNEFFINPADGLPYLDDNFSTPIPTTTAPKRFDGSVSLDLVAKVNGVESDINSYDYIVNPAETTVFAPFVDKAQGMYKEIKQDADNTVLTVKLYSKNHGATIYWRDATGQTNPDAGWTVYNPQTGVKLKKYTLLQCYAEVGGIKSKTASYVYMFKPLAPEITPASGTYAERISDVSIGYNPSRPSDESGSFEYKIKWRWRQGDIQAQYSDYSSPIDLENSAYIMAYVENTASGEISDITSNHYIIKNTNTNSYVEVRAPYNVSSIKTSLLTGPEYVNGIYLDLLIGNFTTHYIEYQYSYTLSGNSTPVTTSWNRYDPNMPILVNSNMENITINARVYRNDGYGFAPYSHTINFIYTAPPREPVYIGGGGGGLNIVDNTKKYTKDIFGDEHPTHIGYINGYEDGSVRADGNITREEIVAILYRIRNKKYDKPFAVTGKIFPDVEKSRWSAFEIEFLYDKNIVLGYPDGEFKPAQNLTRAEFASLIRRYADLSISEKEKNPFTDLEESHWAYEDILSLYESGLVIGYEDGSFGADRKITRAEVIKVINKLLGRNPSDSYVKSLKLNPFNDLDKDKWYYTDVLEATVTHKYTLDYNNLEIKWEDFN